MILGRIIGKTSTHNFQFEVKSEARKFGYVQVAHKDNGFVLAQILEIERTAESSVAKCGIIGYRDSNKILRGLRIPFEPGTEVLRADDDFVKETLGLELNKSGAYLGVLDGREKLRVYLDLDRLLTRHVFITGKSGSGKSYTVSVIIEEILNNNVPLVIIDPHGEYHSLAEPNSAERARLELFGIKPEGFLNKINEFSPDIESNPDARPIRLNGSNLSPSELIRLLPAKLSSSQLGALYSAVKNLGGNASFDDLLTELEILEESSAKWTLINMMDYVKRLNLFSDNPTLPGELVQPGKCSIINLKGVPPEVQEVIVYKIVNDLFTERKRSNIPPFFLVVEEAQNYCPERGFGEAKSSPILRQVAAEGRKFGMGLCVISQRPSRLDKSVISQVSTQVIMKVTNPNDIKAITSSVEGITFELENELQNIPIGTGLVTGIVDLPLLIDIRPRKTRHGGEAVKIFTGTEEDTANLMLVIEPKISARDIMLMENKPVKVSTMLAPCILMRCNQGSDDFNLLIDLNEGTIISDVDKNRAYDITKTRIKDLSPQQNRVFQTALKLGVFRPAELFAKSGVQFSDLYDLITVLAGKGYLVKEGENYRIAEQLSIFSNLQKLACYAKAEYKKLNYDAKLESRLELDKVKDLIARFAQIKSVKECWLVRYKNS